MVRGSTCKQGEAEGVVISTGVNTFFGRAASLVGHDDDTTGHLQKILAQIGAFCLVSIGICIVAEILVLYAGFRYSYRRGLDDILVLLIGDFEVKDRRKHNVFPNKIRRCNKFVNYSRGSPLPEQ